MAFSLEGALQGIGSGLSQTADTYSASLEAKKTRDFQAQQNDLQAQRMMHLEELRNKNSLAQQKLGFEHTEKMQEQRDKSALALTDYQDKLARGRQATQFEQEKEMLGLRQAGEMELYDKKLASQLKMKEQEVKLAKTQSDSILKEKLDYIDQADFMSDDLKKAAKFKVLTGIDLLDNKGNKVSDEQWLKANLSAQENFNLKDERDQKKYMRENGFKNIDEARVSYGINESLKLFPQKSSSLPQKEAPTTEQFVASLEQSDIDKLTSATPAIREYYYNDIKKRYGDEAVRILQQKVDEALGQGGGQTALGGSQATQSNRRQSRGGATGTPIRVTDILPERIQKDVAGQQTYLKSLKGNQ